MAMHPRRPTQRRPTAHDTEPPTSAQIERQQILARALPTLARYYPGKSWAGAYIPTPAPAEHRHQHISLEDELQLRAAWVDEDGDE